MSSLARASKRTYLWAPVFFYAVLIFFLSSLSFRFSWFEQGQKSHIDWVAHVVEYGIFGALLGRALWFHSPFWGSPARLFTAVMLIGVLYGASDEFHQSFVAGRDASVQDLCFDAVGTALGALVWVKKRERTNA